MRPLTIGIAVSALLFTCAAQNRGGATGHSYSGAAGHTYSGAAGHTYSGASTRFYTYTGPGHNPLAGPPAGSVVSPGFPSGLAANVMGNAWRGYGSSYRGRYYGRGGYGYGGGYALAYPVFVGPSPYDYGYLPPNYPPPEYYGDEGPPQPPAVVINQNFVPDVANPVVREYGPEDQEPGAGMRNYQNVPPPKQPEPEATIYLIAFKDHSVVPALGWWVEGNTIKYVNLDHDINQASVDLIDRDLSKKLNAQRNVEFTLPPG